LSALAAAATTVGLVCAFLLTRLSQERGAAAIGQSISISEHRIAAFPSVAEDDICIYGFASVQREHRHRYGKASRGSLRQIRPPRTQILEA
jgi:hypothetical protein